MAVSEVRAGFAVQSPHSSYSSHIDGAQARTHDSLHDLELCQNRSSRRRLGDHALHKEAHLYLGNYSSPIVGEACKLVPGIFSFLVEPSHDYLTFGRLMKALYMWVVISEYPLLN